ncbi:MAG: 7-carboxy-7-deazaguanine synthase QueE [Acidobacteria bacterium]|nr:MAG: 7-carboxy-7-deazaguanine synthase QueE [Acidobacteriota bacterium]
MKVNEIFATIEGETSLTGLPMLFVRFTGCPLRCTYCDTAYAYDKGTGMSVEKLIETIDTYGLSTVHLTGGEPLAQSKLPVLVGKLLEKNYQLVIETGGSLDIKPVTMEGVRIMLDIKTPGSGMDSRNCLSNLKQMRSRTDEFKFTLCHRKDYDWAVNFLERHRLKETGCVINFSPVSPGLAPAELADWILKDRLPVRLNCQLHRFIWPDQNRGV